MKIKTKNLEQSYDSKLKTSTSGFTFCFCVFRFVLVFCFLTSLASAEISAEQLDPTDFLIPYLTITSQNVKTTNVTAGTSQDVSTPNVPATPNALFHLWEPPMQADKLQSAQQEKTQTSDTVSVNSAAQADQKSPQSGFTVPENLNSHLGRQLWQVSISVPKGEKDKRSKNELQQIIEQIRSVEFEPQKETSKPVAAVKPVSTTIDVIKKPSETSVDTKVQEEPKKREIESGLPYEPVTAQTLQMLENLAQHPGRLDNPFELGEVLFLSGHLKEAAVFYREALNRKSPDEPGLAQDRAWILFQIGNCLRHDDLSTAMKMYRQLIAEYPNSPWVDSAKIQDKLIDWYEKDKPRTLITESQFQILQLNREYPGSE